MAPNTNPAQDWTALLAAAGIAEPPGRAAATEGSTAAWAAREARRALAPTEAARQEIERIKRRASSERDGG